MLYSLLMAAEAAAGAAAGKKELGFVAAIEEGGPVTWFILAVMVIMSVVSWYIMLTKYFEQNKVLKQLSDGSRSFWGAPSIKDGQAKLEKNSALRQLVDDGVRAEEEHGKLIDPQDQHEWMHSSLQRSQDSISSVLSNGLSFLATVGSTAPFVGLLGTVWGILNALIKIAVEGDASIDKVAGPVGEALYMTAIGLVVAVPAVMGYNWLQRRNKLIAERMSKFCNDLHGTMMSNGAIRPVVAASKKVAAPAPAKPAAPAPKA
jgi:biopolymer transport protein ExbB